MQPELKNGILLQLREKLLQLEGLKYTGNEVINTGLGSIHKAFPNSRFPLGCVHEFLSPQFEGKASSVGFLSGLLSSLIGNNKAGVWISSQRSVFPPALKTFGLEPDRILFVDLPREKDVQWAMEEALKCSAITVAVAEMRDISFTASRRLQLAVEESKVTGFILRTNSKKPTTTACVSRWRITPLPSETLGDLPGIGFPRWRVELLRIRNGRPGSWNVEWRGDRFAIIDTDLHSSLNNPLLIKAG